MGTMIHIVRGRVGSDHKGLNLRSSRFLFAADEADCQEWRKTSLVTRTLQCDLRLRQQWLSRSAAGCETRIIAVRGTRDWQSEIRTI
jgi:hypothetical protein